MWERSRAYRASVFPPRGGGVSPAFVVEDRIHRSLRVTPAMGVGVTTKLWRIEDIVEVVE